MLTLMEMLDKHCDLEEKNNIIMELEKREYNIESIEYDYDCLLTPIKDKKELKLHLEACGENPTNSELEQWILLDTIAIKINKGRGI